MKRSNGRFKLTSAIGVQGRIFNDVGRSLKSMRTLVPSRKVR
jgi:hypothetical protein